MAGEVALWSFHSRAAGRSGRGRRTWREYNALQSLCLYHHHGHGRRSRRGAGALRANRDAKPAVPTSDVAGRGVENFFAAALGAIFLQILLELLRTSFSIGGVEVDMTVWRLVFFGVLLMLVLRFARNGLIAPVIDWFYRAGVAEETVAKRKAGGATS